MVLGHCCLCKCNRSNFWYDLHPSLLTCYSHIPNKRIDFKICKSCQDFFLRKAKGCMSVDPNNKNLLFEKIQLKFRNEQLGFSQKLINNVIQHATVEKLTRIIRKRNSKKNRKRKRCCIFDEFSREWKKPKIGQVSICPTIVQQPTTSSTLSQEEPDISGLIIKGVRSNHGGKRLGSGRKKKPWNERSESTKKTQISNFKNVVKDFSGGDSNGLLRSVYNSTNYHLEDPVRKVGLNLIKQMKDTSGEKLHHRTELLYVQTAYSKENKLTNSEAFNLFGGKISKSQISKSQAFNYKNGEFINTKYPFNSSKESTDKREKQFMVSFWKNNCKPLPGEKEVVVMQRKTKFSEKQTHRIHIQELDDKNLFKLYLSSRDLFVFEEFGIDVNKMGIKPAGFWKFMDMKPKYVKMKKKKFCCCPHCKSGKENKRRKQKILNQIHRNCTNGCNCSEDCPSHNQLFELWCSRKDLTSNILDLQKDLEELKSNFLKKEIKKKKKKIINLKKRIGKLSKSSHSRKKLRLLKCKAKLEKSETREKEIKKERRNYINKAKKNIEEVKLKDRKLYYEHLNENLKKYEEHCKIVQHQGEKFKEHLKSIRKGEGVAVADFAGKFSLNYDFEDTQQGWFDTKYAGDLVFSLYYLDYNGEIQVQYFDYFSEYQKSDFYFTSTVLDHFFEKVCKKYGIVTLSLWTDGAPTHFKMSKTKKYACECSKKNKILVYWNYFGSCHGKGPSDGHIGVGKQMLFRKARAGEVISCVEDINQMYVKYMKNTTSLVINVDSSLEFESKTLTGIKKFYQFKFQDGIIYSRFLSGVGNWSKFSLN